jgi:hypothetical protein
VARDDPDLVRLAAQAYLCAQPVLALHEEMVRELVTEARPVGVLRHATALPRPPDARPWSDPLVLRSLAWLDLRGGPVAVHHPPLPAGRVGVDLVDLLGRRVARGGTAHDGVGCGEGGWVVLGPGRSSRAASAGPSAPLLTPVPVGTALARLVLRIRVGAGLTIPDAVALQHGFRLRARTAAHRPVPVAGPGPTTFLGVLAAVLHQSRPGPGPEQDLAARLVAAGLLDPVLPPATSRAVARGAALGAARLRDAVERTSSAGHLPTDPILARAVLTATAPDDPDPAEVLTVRLGLREGETPHGDHRYRVVLRAGDLVHGRLGWSMAVYRAPGGDLVPNATGRHAVHGGPPDAGSATTVTVLLGPDLPGRGTPSLPVPPGPFAVLLRLYGPDEAAPRDGWSPPVLHDDGPVGR